MKSFYQLSEQARRHQTKKALNEAGVAPAPAAGQAQAPAPAAGQPAQQQQAQPQQNPAAQAGTALQQAWDKFAADQNNKVTLDTLKKAGFDATTTFSTALKTFIQKLGSAPAPAPAAAAPAAGAATPATK